MTNHQKRLAAPESWPVGRKEETFTVKAGAGPHGEDGVPLLIILRDVLGYADSRKEARYALDQDTVVINGKPVSDEERPVGMFDIVTFTERGEHYRVFPDEGGRLSLTPIDETAAGSKLGKVVGKQHVPGGDVQLTLHDGQTLLVDDDATYGVGDSLVVDNDDDSIVAHFEYEEGALATAVAGQHAGRIGTIDEIQVTASSAANNVLLSAHGDGEDFETLEEYIVVIDENFIDDDATDAESEMEAAEMDGEEPATDDEPETEPDTDEPETEPDTDEDEAEPEGDETEAGQDDESGEETEADSGTADSETDDSGTQEDET